MTEMPSLLRLAGDAARHAAARQTVIATNVANADTPGYRAHDVAAFVPEGDAMPMRATRAGHLGGAGGTPRALIDRDAAADLSGNTVSLDTQVLRGIEAQRAHNRALTVYSATLDLLRAGLGRR
jgi:flagellar basal-body rod protein FlgB